MNKTIAQIKQQFEDLLLRTPDQVFLKDKQIQDRITEALCLFVDAQGLGTHGQELGSEIEAYLKKHLEPFGEKSRLFFEQFAKRAQETHETDQAMLSSPLKRW